jgi:hypothetical protein
MNSTRMNSFLPLVEADCERLTSDLFRIQKLYIEVFHCCHRFLSENFDQKSDDSVRMDATERMDLNLCRPSFPVKQASVIPFHKIVCLTRLFPGQAVEFIWRGELLLQKMTFLFYQIAPLSSIVVLPDDVARQPHGINEWAAVTRDADTFNEQIRVCTNPQVRSEAARLRDLQFWRMEKRGKPALSAAGSFNFNDPIASFNRANRDLNVKFEAAGMPQCDPLPNPWKANGMTDGTAHGV